VRYLVKLVERDIADAGVISVTAEAAIGFYRLEFTVELLPNRETLNIQSISRFGGELLLRLTRGGTPLPVSPLAPYSNGPTSLPWVGGERLLMYLVADLDRSRLSALEEIRAGNEITLTVRLNLELQEGDSTTWTVVLMDHALKRDAWLEILKNLGFADRMLLEVPSLSPPSNPRLAQVFEHLQRAQNALLEGEYREAIGRCRDVLEALSLALGDGDRTRPEVEALFANSRTLDKDERLQALRRALKLLTHPARHADEVAQQIEWTRADALTVVHIVAALLARL
jgi:hypothetical protein